MLGGFRDFVQIPGGGRGNAYSAFVSVTALAKYITASGAVGGPLLYNPVVTGNTKGVTAYLLSMSWGLSVASTVAGSIGIEVGLTATAPSSTGTTGLLTGPLSPSDSASVCSAFSVGTPASGATTYTPFGRVHTGAITVDTDDDNTVHLGGIIRLMPGQWLSPAAGAALTTSVIDIGIVWLEIANN